MNYRIDAFLNDRDEAAWVYFDRSHLPVNVFLHSF